MLHLDGKLSALKELISKAPIDVVESFTMPEQGGDLELEEAHKAWKDKVIAANIPANLAYRQEKEIAEFFENLMGRRCLKERFVLELSEDLPREHLGKVLSVLSKTLSNLQKGGE
jgi:EAL domain-containing protein (putative c-di-GMP-specific phosphodiesterase class I)